MPDHRLIACACCVGAMIAAATAAGTGAQESLDRFLVALTADSHDAVIPFASFDGRRWHSRWGAPSDGDPGTDQPPFETISQIPMKWWGSLGVQTSWELVFLGGGRRHVDLMGTVLADLGSGCARNLGLSGELGSYPPHTLAATAPGAVSAVDHIKEGSGDWKAISALLPAIFRRAAKLKSPEHVPQAAASTPQLRAATLASGPRGEFVYFESTRYSRPPTVPPDQHLDEFPTIVHGWLWRPDPLSRFQVVSTESFDDDFSERKGSNSFLPRGVVRAGGREYWLGMLASYAFSAPVVFDVSRAGVREILREAYAGC